MSKTQRNAPCPCGSGRKYKKCCLAADNQADTERLNKQRAEQVKREQQLRASSLLDPSWVDDERAFIELTNGVVDLVNDNRFDEALAHCQRLLDEYPETIDGLDRSGIVHEAQRNHELAADFYRRCLAFIQRPDQRSAFEQSSIDFYRGKVDQMEKLAQTG